MKANFNKLQEIDTSKNPFKVPENYFAQFNEEIMNRLPEKEFAAPVTVTLWDRVKPWVYMAAMFIGLYLTINYVFNYNKGDSSVKALVVAEQAAPVAINANGYWSTVNITEEEFYEYLEEQLIEDSYYDFMYDQYYLN